MTTPDGLTAESEALHIDIHEDTRPCQPGPLGVCPWVLQLRAIEATAAASRVRETGCDQLREAMARHRLMFPPHPHGFYIHSALCSCDTWQWDGPGPDLSPVAEQVWADWSDHLRAALAPTVAASEACAREGCGHRMTEHAYYPDEPWHSGCTDCLCTAFIAPSPATEAERRGGER